MNEAPKHRPFSAIEIAALITFIACFGGLIYQYNRSHDPDVIAAQLKPLVAAQWQPHPVMKFTRVEGVTLEHKSGVGFVEYKLGEYQTRVPVTVQANRNPLEWKLDAGEGGMPLNMAWFGDHQVWAEHPMTMADAKAYAEWTANQKYLGPDPGSTVLSKVGEVVIVHIAMQAHVLADMEADRELHAKADKFFRAIAEGLSEHVFRGPVDIHLGDAKVTTKKVIAWR